MFKTFACVGILASLALNCGEQREEPSSRNPQAQIDQVLGLVKSGDLNRVKEYVEGGGNVNAKNKSEEFLLLVAVWNKQNEIASFLLQNGANPNLTDFSGQSPIFAATYERNLEMVNELIAHKADVDIVTKAGETALLRAVAWGNRPIVTALMKAGADPNKVSDHVLQSFRLSREAWNNEVRDLRDHAE